MKSSNLRIAIVYDFDGTLSPGNMQEYDFIPAVGKKNEEFWEESEKLGRAQDGDTILAYMYNMFRHAKNNNLSLRREAFVESGSKVELFEGVEQWFALVNAYGKERGITIEHYINSSGIKEMIEGTKIAHEFKKIFACSFFYDIDGVAYWPSVVVNYTTKTQFLFKINKGIDSVSDNVKVNEYIPESRRRIPFSNMIYFGDGTTDIPSMRLVKQMGGHSVAVYDPKEKENKKRIEKIEQLKHENRVDFVMPANYRADSPTMDLVKRIIDKIHAANELRKAGNIEK